MVESRPKRSRRVPEELRKRSVASCDLCRQRRCKCVASESATACNTCIQAGAACSYDLPRKVRFYGSVDDLSEKYRYLEAIVKGVFPHERLDTVHDLLKLGQRHGYLMPDLRDGQQAANPAPQLPEPQDANRSSAPLSSRTRPNLAHRPTPNEPVSTSSLVRDKSGNTYYIGPSGSLNFFAELRELIKERQGAAPSSNTGFVGDDTAQALEADARDEQITTDHPIGSSPASIDSSATKHLLKQSKPSSDYLDQLPSNDVTEALLHSFFDHIHPDFPLFHRASFHDEFEMYVVRMRMSHHGHSSQHAASMTFGPDWGWIACLHMIMILGSLTSPASLPVNMDNLRQSCLSAVSTSLPYLLSHCSISNVQALFLQSLFLHNNNERNGAWNLLGTAIREAIALGLHEISFNQSFRPIQREVRKRVFCTLFSFEQFLSSSLGRPSSLGESDIDFVPPINGLFDDDGGFGDHYALLNLQLQKLLGRTRSALAAMKRPSSESTGRTEGFIKPSDEVLACAASWLNDLPQHLRLPVISSVEEKSLPTNLSSELASLEDIENSLKRQPPQQLRKLLLLHIQYHYISMLVCRTDLLQTTAARAAEGPATFATESSARDHERLCLFHACQSAALISLLHRFQLIKGISALDIFYAYQTAMVLLLQRLIIGPNKNAADGQESDSIRFLTSTLTRIIKETRKSGTMKRFAVVVEKFYLAVTEPQTRQDITNRNTGFDNRALTSSSEQNRVQKSASLGAAVTRQTFSTDLDQARFTQFQSTSVPHPESEGEQFGTMDFGSCIPEDNLWYDPLNCLSDGQLVDWANLEAVFTI